MMSLKASALKDAFPKLEETWIRRGQSSHNDLQNFGQKWLTCRKFKLLKERTKCQSKIESIEKQQVSLNSFWKKKCLKKIEIETGAVKSAPFNSSLKSLLEFSKWTGNQTNLQTLANYWKILRRCRLCCIADAFWHFFDVQILEPWKVLEKGNSAIWMNKNIGNTNLLKRFLERLSLCRWCCHRRLNEK